MTGPGDQVEATDRTPYEAYRDHLRASVAARGGQVRAGQVEAASGPGGRVSLAGNPVVAELVHALRVLGVDTRDAAEVLLRRAPAYPSLTARELATVRLSFPVAVELVDQGQAVRYRWADHANQLGDWCPWSGAGVSAEAAAEDGRRCPAGCPASTVEAVEVDQVDQVDAGTRYRWATHQNGAGYWCRWSHVNVTAKLAASADTRCPADCAGSAIEVDPGPRGE